MEFLFTGATTLVELVKVLEKEEELKNSMLLIDNELVSKLKANMDEKPYKVKGVEELVWKENNGKTIAIIDLEYSTSKCRKVYRICVDGETVFLENNNTFPIKTVVLQ